MQQHLIIALPNRLLAVALAQYVAQWSKEVDVYGVAIDSKELFDLLEHLPTGRHGSSSSVLIYDPYLPGPGPQVIFSRINTEFTNLKTILMKNENANGRFAEAEKCHPSAIIGCDAQPEDLLQMLVMVGKTKNKQLKKAKVKKTKTRPRKNPAKASQAELSPREQEMVNLIAKGHSDREIAFVLDISFYTSRAHVRNILKKLKLSKKIQLISWHASR
jgi:DNA-binding NarL/FixJ family response regulator